MMRYLTIVVLVVRSLPVFQRSIITVTIAATIAATEEACQQQADVLRFFLPLLGLQSPAVHCTVDTHGQLSHRLCEPLALVAVMLHLELLALDSLTE